PRLGLPSGPASCRATHSYIDHMFNLPHGFSMSEFHRYQDFQVGDACLPLIRSASGFLLPPLVCDEASASCEGQMELFSSSLQALEEHHKGLRRSFALLLRLFSCTCTS